jgi:geranylgeranyl pyrophosphate synthase
MNSTEITNETASFAKQLATVGSKIVPVLEKLFPPAAQDFMSHPFWYHMQSGGTRIRPALCLLTCEALGSSQQKAVPFAAAVEILHNMLLVHDDIEDGDEVRRNRPTVWVKYGLENAINVGDYTLGRALSSILTTSVSPERKNQLLGAFIEAYENTCRGQALDLNWRGSEKLTVESYMKLVRLKTGDYLALGMVGGAIIADVPPVALQNIRQLGDKIGPAFQIRDDMLDLTKGKGRGGQIGNDIREGKPSILFAHTLDAAEGKDRDKLLQIALKGRAQTTEDDIQTITRLYQKYGAIEYARSTAQKLVKEALELVEQMPIENKAFFRKIVNFMAQRDK